MKHILLEKIEFRERHRIDADGRFGYHMLGGVWQNAEGNLLLVHDASFSGVSSKKRDIETGEDQK